MNDSVILLQGNQAIDDRGSVSFVNDFSLNKFNRFYAVENHSRGFVRAWHGHKEEAKAVTVIAGTALVCAVKIDNWEVPSTDLRVERFVLSAHQPAVLLIPPGFANGFMTLTSDAKLLFFSSSTLAQSVADDFRFPSDYWDPWKVLQR